MIIKEDFNILNNVRNYGFNRIFIWPVNISGDMRADGLKTSYHEGGVIKLSPSAERQIRERFYKLFGSDILFKPLQDGYGLLFGYFNRSSSKDHKNAESLLQSLGLNPIPIKSETMYSFAMNRDYYPNYTLREYRAGAEKFQSYFKDDHYDYSKKLIEERLEKDWYDSIRPYQIVFHRPNSDEIVIYGNGLILLTKLTLGIDIANRISEIAIKDYNIISGRASNVRISIIPDLPIKVKEIFPLFIPITSSSVDKEAAANKLIRHLGGSFIIYGGSTEDGTYYFNLQKEIAEENRIKITSSFAINIRKDEIIMYPTEAITKSDVIEVYYGIERFFPIEESRTNA